MKENIGKILAVVNGVKGQFVLAIIFGIYSLIAVGAMSITYIVFKKLDELGVFTMIKDALQKDLAMLTDVAVHCTGKILDISALFQCLSSNF